MTDRVEVLLATYNSGDYLAELLASLLTQHHDDFHLIVSDDGSTDDTIETLQRYAGQFRNPVQIRRRSTPSGSAMANFSGLLEQSTGDYVFLADHDDVWLPEKISEGVKSIKATEDKYGIEKPVLYHSDMSIINAHGEVIHASYWNYKRQDPCAGESLGTALIQPVVAGCAMAMNRALVRKATPVPPEALMHDWWILLVACTFGTVLHEAQPQIQYRIHGSNASRPKEVGLKAALKQLDRVPALRRGMRRRVAQGAAFYARFADEMPATLARQSALFASLPQSAPGVRQYKMLKGGFLGPDPLRNFVQLLLI